ncbi:hypothetical protein SS50377_21600 [Spironucleus salmonicida]|uniref:Uncharacterized protein n=1 Tax=Spironucleus salmonicida TaxID=348837 RepID=V6LN59_9EUKA|nr:hypothetical protein SS50377_21600 [Spironucleus salmonicida]|eukprot:EST46137.1 Hypothetical protein SS50377_13854 [Spironucleus salmonicida]
MSKSWTPELTSRLIALADAAKTDGIPNFAPAAAALSRPVYQCQLQYFRKTDPEFAPAACEQLEQIWAANAGKLNFARVAAALGHSVFSTKWQLARLAQKRGLEPFFELRPQAYRGAWDASRDAQLRALRAAGAGFAAIGRALGCSDRACQQRFHVLGRRAFCGEDAERLRALLAARQGRVSSQVLCGLFPEHDFYSILGEIWGQEGEEEEGVKYDVLHEVADEE